MALNSQLQQYLRNYLWFRHKDKQSFFLKSKRIKYFQLDIFQKKQIISFAEKWTV